MVKIYVKKIVNKEINLVTGKPWTIEDVPAYWQKQVREALENN